MYLGTVIYSQTNQQLCWYYISAGKKLPRGEKRKKSSRIFERDGLFHIPEELGCDALTRRKKT